MVTFPKRNKNFKYSQKAFYLVIDADIALDSNEAYWRFELTHTVKVMPLSLRCSYLLLREQQIFYLSLPLLVLSNQ